MQDSDLTWAQNVINGWATKKAAAAPTVTTIPESEEIPMSRCQDSKIIVNGEAWGKQELADKLLLLADPCICRLRCISDAVKADEEMSELAHELIVLDIELWSDATGVSMTKLMRMKDVKKLTSMLEARPGVR